MQSKNCPTCENKCVNCGVCPTLKVKKTIDKKYEPDLSEKTSQLPVQNTKYRMIVDKTGDLRYISHLDFQSTLIKIIKRTGLEVAYSEGFNPSPKISLGVALPLFTQSISEIVDFELVHDYDVEKVKELILNNSENKIQIKSIIKSAQKFPPADILCQWALYKIEPIEKLSKKEDLLYIKDRINSSDNLFIEKKNKKGIIKQIDIKSSIKKAEFKDNVLYLILKSGQSSDLPALRADTMLAEICPEKIFDITRIKFYDKDFKEI